MCAEVGDWDKVRHRRREARREGWSVGDTGDVGGTAAGVLLQH